jgi:putative sigma-54 modulation protein
MRLQITTRHYDLPADLKSLTVERLMKLKRFFDGIIDVNLILSTEKHRHHAEVMLHTGGHDWIGNAEAGDMRTAIDDAVAKIEVQLKKHKDRLTDRKGLTPLGEALSNGAEPDGTVEIEE